MIQFDGGVFLLVLIGQAVGLFVAAMHVGSPWLLLVPILGWPLFFIGIEREWWASSLDTEVSFALALELGVAGVIGVLIGLFVHRRRLRTST